MWKVCIRRIESLCSRFLWSGATDRRANAKIVWKTCCLPKAEGGIGLRNFKIWNLTLLLRLGWLLFSGSSSLWVAWHCSHNCPSSYAFWSQVESPSQSWSWRSILRLREILSRFLFSEIHSGQNTSFWFDNWSPLGPLIGVFGREGTRNLRIHIDAPVSASWNAGGWSLPHPRSEQEVNLHLYLTGIPLLSIDRGPDQFFWLTNGIKNRVFSSSKTWDALRPRAAIQDVAKHLWFSGAMPKHAFHFWVTNLNRLPTHSRLASWGLQVQTECCVCNSEIENRDHLMLTCHYATVLWSQVRPPEKLRMMVVQAMVYNIWQQRNNNLHNQTLQPPLVVFKHINRHIINSIYALIHRKKFSSLMQLWLI
ncbi:hypothetical protein Bca52824_086233 [Brassica carinata]|uniref:Reverse transcriptase zinc-binding domain-containing protein n=1 Tax=Brassica carinata TaxID=52824 RepID=A0A8X7P8L5_BRACI|nr:hypothetical protein Bca52824_086233 [Brassica carinata]